MTAPPPSGCQQLRSASKAQLRKQLLIDWEREWKQEKRGRALFRTTPKPTRKVLELHRTVSKAISSVIIQMRTEKIGLRPFLYQWKVPDIENGFCECRRGLQTVRHIILECDRLTRLRRTVLYKGGVDQKN